MHLSAPRNRYIHTMASKGKMLCGVVEGTDVERLVAGASYAVRSQELSAGGRLTFS